jgi:hypothetical protein
VEFLEKIAKVMIDGEMFDDVQSISIENWLGPKDAK